MRKEKIFIFNKIHFQQIIVTHCLHKRYYFYKLAIKNLNIMAKQVKLGLTPKQKKQLEYGIVLGFLFLAFFFWNSFFIYPIKLFVILTHEMSHGLAAILTGGQLDSILITSSLGGESRTIEGNKFVITSAGYLGSLLFGVALFIAGHKEKFRKTVSVLLAILLILFAANFLEGNLGRISSVFFA